MTYSNEIPANVIAYVRAGSRAELDATLAELAAAWGRVLKDRDGRALSKHHVRELDPLVDRCKRHYELLDLIGWDDGEDSDPVEMDPSGDWLCAVGEALELLDLEHPGVDTAEIEAFRLDVGLTFKRGGE